MVGGVLWLIDLKGSRSRFKEGSRLCGGRTKYTTSQVKESRTSVERQCKSFSFNLNLISNLKCDAIDRGSFGSSKCGMVRKERESTDSAKCLGASRLTVASDFNLVTAPQCSERCKQIG